MICALRIVETSMAPPAVCFCGAGRAVVSLAAPPPKGERSAGRRGMLARHPLRACEARGRRLRGVFTSLAIGTSRLSALHRGICRLGHGTDNAREAGYKPEPQEAAPGSAQRDCLRKTPLR